MKQMFSLKRLFISNLSHHADNTYLSMCPLITSKVLQTRHCALSHTRMGGLSLYLINFNQIINVKLNAIIIEIYFTSTFKLISIYS